MGMSLSLSRKREKVSLVVAVLFTLVWLIGSLFSSIPSFADVTDTATYAAEVKNQMQADYANEKYGTSGGGYYTIADLMTNQDAAHPNLYVINERNFNQLTSSAKTEFMSDLNAAATKVVANSSNGVYTQESQTNWYKVLQTQDGVGTKFMSVLLENVKPDFVTANNIIAPFSGLLGTTMGVMAILIMALIGVVMAADIMYIAIPPFRLVVSDDENGGLPKSKIFTHDAIYAVQTAENDSGNGTPKIALGIYFKRRVLTLIMLGICLLYLVSGQIYTFVGYILDLVSGFM